MLSSCYSFVSSQNTIDKLLMEKQAVLTCDNSLMTKKAFLTIISRYISLIYNPISQHILMALDSL